MLDSPFFGTILSLVTLYLIFSQLTLSLVELPAGVLNTRGIYLYDRLREALGPDLHSTFYAADTITALKLPETEKSWLFRRVPLWPTYISETLFAQTIVACVVGLAPAAGLTPIAQFGAGLDELSKNKANTFTQTLRILYLNAASVGSTPAEQSAALQRNLEGWFHDFGERLTGWYKRGNRKYLFLVGLLVAVGADVDTVRLARFLGDSGNAAARLALVEAGVQATQGARPADGSYRPTDPAATQHPARPDRFVAQADSLLTHALAAVPAAGLPLGLLRWTHADTRRTDTTTMLVAATHRRRYAKPASYAWAPTADDFGMPTYARRWQLAPQTGRVALLPGAFWRTVGGWLLTAFAMMLGAPFWFDTLCRFVNIRNVGIKPAPASKAS